MNRSLGPFVLWCAAGLYFICVYPMSPPGLVPGLSAFTLAKWLFGFTSCLLMLSVFKLGERCMGCGPREGRIKRMAYAWLSLVVLLASLGVYDLVLRGRDKVTLPLLVAYGVAAFFLIGVFFVLRYWKERTGRQEDA